MISLQKYQMVGFQYFKGLPVENHIGSMFRTQQQRLDNMVTTLLDFKYGTNTERFLKRLPTKVLENDSLITWDVVGSSRRNIPIIEVWDENEDPITSGMVGAGRRPFYMVFGEDWWADGNMIVGEKNELYPVRILADARMKGDLAVYKCQVWGSVGPEGIPVEEFEMGKRWSQDFSPVENELSREVGEVRFAAPTSMMNEWSTIRLKHKEPGSMIYKKLAVGLPTMGKDGKVRVDNYWMQHAEWVVETQFAEDKNRLLMFGTTNRNSNGEYADIGKSGRVIKAGSGIREQMSFGNVVYYNKFSLKLILDQLYFLSAGRLDMDQRYFIIRTGEMGARQFHEAAKDTASGFIPYATTNNPATIHKVQSELHQNALAAGYQFVEWWGPNNVRFRVEVDPMYDDPERNKITHPNGGLAESYRMDVMYVGDRNNPNIQLVTNKSNPEVRSYQPGIRNPFTGENSLNYASMDEDSSVIHRMWQAAAIVKDPTKVISFIPSILR